MLRATLIAWTLAAAAPVTACPAPPMDEMRVHLDAVNAQRAQAGRAPLMLSPALGALAQDHACDMARRGFFSHTAPDGADMMTRARRAGLRNLCRVAENIARGQRDIPTVMGTWMRSAGHRRNILDPALTQVGFGRAPGAHWVQVFGTVCG